MWKERGNIYIANKEKKESEVEWINLKTKERIKTNE